MLVNGRFIIGSLTSEQFSFRTEEIVLEFRHLICMYINLVWFWAPHIIPELCQRSFLSRDPEVTRNTAGRNLTDKKGKRKYSFRFLAIQILLPTLLYS